MHLVLLFSYPTLTGLFWGKEKPANREIIQKGSNHLSKLRRSFFPVLSLLLLILLCLLARTFWDPLSSAEVSFFSCSSFLLLAKEEEQSLHCFSFL